MIIWIIALLSISLGALAQYFLKIGASSTLNATENNSMFAHLLNLLGNPHFLGGIASYGISLVLWLYVLSKWDLSKAYPLVSLGYVFTAILGYFFLNESLNIYRILGLAFIISGVIFISQS